MSAAQEDHKQLVEQQALNALHYLSDKDKQKVLEYIESILTLENTKNDQASSAKD
jgi:hypothetical protein